MFILTAVSSLFLCIHKMASYIMNKITLSQTVDKGKSLKSSIVEQSKKVGNMIKTSVNSAGTKWNESPTVAKACIIGSAASLAAPLLIIPALGVVGFTSAGVAAGSLAASMQTATTVSGSVFALCQSAGAVGAVATSTSVGVGMAAGATAASVTAAVCRKTGRRQNNEEEGQTEVEEQEDAQGNSDGPSEVEEQEDAQGNSDGQSDSLKEKVE